MKKIDWVSVATVGIIVASSALIVSAFVFPIVLFTLGAVVAGFFGMFFIYMTVFVVRAAFSAFYRDLYRFLSHHLEERRNRSPN